MSERTVVYFGGVPSVSFKMQIPGVREEIKYSNMNMGSDDTVFVAAPSKIVVEVEHEPGLPQYKVVAMAYGKLLRETAEVTWEEFKAIRQRIIDEARGQVSL